MPYHYTCRQCGTGFSDANKGRVYCSKACYDAGQTVYRRARRKCLECKKAFSPGSGREEKGKKYCSMACYDSARTRRTTHTCVRCGKAFSRPKNLSARGKCLYCGPACAGTAKQAIVSCTCQRCGKAFSVPEWRAKAVFCSSECRWPNRPSEKLCLQCGKPFRKKSRSRYCSKACQFEAQSTAPEISCLICGKVFKITTKRLGEARFCSVRCTRKHVGETQIEALVRRALEALGVPFHQEWKAGRYSLDFYLPLLNVGIEADGAYWHRDKAARDAKRDAAIKAICGAETVRIGEKEIRAAADLPGLIRARLGL